MTTKIRLLLVIAGAIGLLTVSTWLIFWHSKSNHETKTITEATEAHFIGSQACAGCHQNQTERWKLSDHHRAMEPANEKTVLGNFNNSSFNYFGRKTFFSRQENKFQVKTENQEGKIETFTVAYTLGFKPLQQYLVKFPDGRIQTLPFAWDTRAKDKGGQRWFHLYPKENIKPENPLFWTRPMQNWNHMCGDCHTTNFSKNFSDHTNTFESHWSETGNGCESCHGAGSAHAELMKQNRHVIENNFLIKKLATQSEQMDQCGMCHARRDRLKEDPSHEKMLQTWQPEILRENMYFTNGLMQDEVFNVGSFMQSKMYAAGVACSNCHNPHTGKPKIEGNGLCTQCHVKDTYDSAQHYFHTPGSTAAQCVTCHMPTRTYMVVDPRHDHSFSIPRPDLSLKLGGVTNAPNVCVSCHQGEMHQIANDSQWAAKAIEMHLKKIGKNDLRREHFASTFWQARHEQAGADSSLQKLIVDDKVNGIVKATALIELGNYLSPQSLEVIQTHLNDNDALIRLGAVEALSAAAPEQRALLLAKILNDSSLAVRIAIAPLMLGIDQNSLTSEQQIQLENIFHEYKDMLLSDSDRGNALASLANFSLMQGDLPAAQQYFEKALQRDEKSLPVLLNYADYYRHTNNDNEAKKLLRKAISIYPDSPDAHYALGLLFVREKNYPVAMNELKQAKLLAPLNSQYAYVYAIGLYSSGSIEQALSVLAEAHNKFPANQQVVSALLSYCEEQNNSFAICKKH